MMRIAAWIARHIGTRTLLVVLLLLVVMSSIAGVVAGRVRSLENALLTSMTVLGSLLTWLLARTKLRGVIAIPLIGLAGLLVISIQVGNLGPHAVRLAGALYRVDREFHNNYRFNDADLQVVFTTLSELGADLLTLFNRVGAWVLSIVGQKAQFDPAATAIVWGLVFWFVSAFAAWGIRRRAQALLAILPALILLLAICAYTGLDNLVILVWPFFTMLVLMALVGHAAREAGWAAKGIDYSEDIRFDMTMVVTPLAAVLVAMAWFVPSISLDQIANAFQQAMSEPSKQAQPVSDSLGLAPRPAPTAILPQLRAPGLPRSHLIGSGPELTREKVMSIYTGDLPPEQTYAGFVLSTPPRYYWRSTVYDRYIGSGWSTSNLGVTDYSAGTIAITYTFNEQRAVRQKVQTAKDLAGQIFTAGPVSAIDRDYQIAWRANNDAFSVLLKSNTDTYTADSTISTASVEELRAVRSDYPDLVTQRYMQLPEDTPQRVYTLARDLTATSPTPYDRAVSIESYLRAYSYTLDLPAPPAGRDVADYFLFDLKRGYCDYFATSMVVLARAAGIPARMVVGYATGTYDSYNARYLVTEADAHSWPELYFNGYGWVEFEPTSGQPSLLRTGIAVQHGQFQRVLPPLQRQDEWMDYLGEVLALVSLILLIILYPVGLVLDWWLVARMSPEHAISRLYVRVVKQAQRLSITQVQGDTAYEYLEKLTQRTHQITNTPLGSTNSSDTDTDMEYLCNLFIRTVYGRYQPSPMDRALAWRRWRRTNIRLWQLTFYQYFLRGRQVLFRRTH